MFKVFKAQVAAQFNKMVGSDLFTVKLDKNELFDTYLAALPESERASHVCNCCRSFLNQYGNIVTIDGDKIKTMWDFSASGEYKDVPNALQKLILSKPIENVFLNTFKQLGTDHNHQRLESGEVIRWEHFCVELPKDKVFRSSTSITSEQGQIRATHDVFLRSLETITPDAVNTVLELISENSLYRGKEFEAALKGFKKNQIEYAKAKNKDAYVWANAKLGGRIRNTVIGQLLVDLSEGKELESAVKAFERMVAPANYKRPTALVTESMIKKAQMTLIELGLDKALARRHATKDDIPVSQLLFVNRDAVNLDVFASMQADVPVNAKTFAKVKELSLKDFLDTVLPTATSIDLLLKNDSSFVNLMAPVNGDAENLMAWDNPISWTYQNNMADAIKEKVKQAGGATDGELRVSLEWFNHDDLDLYVDEPNGNEISFRSPRARVSDGFLDVDMNRGCGTTREPVENITFPLSSKMSEGVYKVKVHNFAKRENTGLGFNIQIECRGNVYDLSHPKAVTDKQNVVVASFKYSRKDGITDMKTSLTEAFSQKEVNGMMTNRFQKVNMMLYSPNHWNEDKGTGNKHLFFILDKARVDNDLRPFFNEYLKPSLQEHRKVFELLGNKLMVKPADNQLAGVGFSLTQPTQVILRVNGVAMKVNI